MRHTNFLGRNTPGILHFTGLNLACVKEGYLMKQINSFQRWRKRYFKLKGRKLYYAKDTKSVIFDEIDLNDLSVAECSTKNVNHSFQVITPFRCLVVCADTRREMEEWISALRAASNKEFYEVGDHDFLSGQHNWYAASHARPTYCNVCREALSGVTSHGLSCEVCKLKSHKKCAAKVTVNCKWTTLASVGKDIIEDEDGNIAMHHQWMEGNLPVSAKCAVCDRTCGSVLRLQDWRCLWCRAMVHTSCKPLYKERCPLGPCKLSVVPPTALHSIGSDDTWEATRPVGCSPLLVFVNSKSGDNQGVKFLRRFKQLLNPAQVFDLMNGGPGLGLRLFKTFDPFRILVCGGDGSIGWVLSELDKLHMHKQCQLGVLPLGTGNDLARVLGWGSVCDDDTQLPQLLEKYEKASNKMLDRWSIMTYEGSVPIPRKASSQYEPIAAYEDSVVAHLSKILHSDQHSVVISSAKVLCETVRDFVAKVGAAYNHSESESDDSIAQKCAILNEKLDSLLATLNEEELAIDGGDSGGGGENTKQESCTVEIHHQESVDSEIVVREETEKELDNAEEDEIEKLGKPEKEAVNLEMANSRKSNPTFIQKEALMSRANSLKKAVRQIIEHAEKAVDEQNAQTKQRETRNSVDSTASIKTFSKPTFSFTSIDSDESQDEIPSVMSFRRPTAMLNVLPTIESVSTENTPCPSPIPPSSSPALTSPSQSPLPFFDRPGCNSEDDQSVLTSPFRSIPFASYVEASEEKQDLEEVEKNVAEPQSPIRSETVPVASRRISSGSTLKHVAAVAGISALAVPNQGVVLPLEKCRSPEPEIKRELPIINPLSSLPIWPNIAGGSLISKVLLANADALCAAASPLMDTDNFTLEGFEEKCVMNNYFGIGLDAKITLDFHNKREEHPEKCRSRTKNFMWYGVLGGKEILQKTYKNLEQKVLLECDGQRIPLPSLQGIVVLNIPSFAGGTNFWGGTKEDDIFFAPSFDDKILEVVAVFGSVQMAASRLINIQHHRIAQCRSVKITILGDEGVPIQVDGEAWIQPPGVIRIVHKNRSQMLCRNRHLENTLRAWEEKQRSVSGLSGKHTTPVLPPLTEEEAQLFAGFLDIAQSFLRSMQLAAVAHPAVEQELLPLCSQVSSQMDQFLSGAKAMDMVNIRLQVTEFVHNVRQLHHETSSFLKERPQELSLLPEHEDKISKMLNNLEVELVKCADNNGVVHFHGSEDEQLQEKKKRGLFKLMFKKPDKNKDAKISSPVAGMELSVHLWGTEEVGQWLDALQLGEYKENFLRHDIRGSELLHLERRDFKDLGISKVGHVKRILQAIKDISNLPSSSTAANHEKQPQQT
ncbi:hypothetical protein CHUAL_001321 [Chamberlinius hualienensis]